MKNKSDEKNIKNGVLINEFSSWTKFCEYVIDYNRCPSTLIFRGQANADWKVESSLDRKEKEFPNKPNLAGNTPKSFCVPRVERKLQINRFKEMARGKLANPPGDDEDNEWWTLAQHHGLATPMLDWTYSPFVALFFAFENNLCLCGQGEGGIKYEDPKYRSVFALAHHLVREGETSQKKAPMPFSPKDHGNYRLINQGGIFLRMPDPEIVNGGDKLRYIDLELYISEHFQKDTWKDPGDNGQGGRHPRAILEKCIIPNEGRLECLRYLDRMNINRSSLFPDLDGAARYVNDLWEINFDSAIGHINTD